MDILKKRKMLEILRGLIGSGFEGNQTDIVHHLKKKGFDVTQSTVSRALTKIGAVKSKKAGKTIYSIDSTQAPQFSTGSVGDLVLSTTSNESTLIIKTTPGSAMFVAGFIDHYCGSFVLGTIAGDDTIFVAPKTVKKIKSSMKQLQDFFNN